jgi:hypothetical protein
MRLTHQRPPAESARPFHATPSKAEAQNFPAPSTWAMMLIGFAGLGFLTYRWMKKSAAV